MIAEIIVHEDSTLLACPPGLFMHVGKLFVKTTKSDCLGMIDAYSCDTGKWFYGDYDKVPCSQEWVERNKARNNTIVQPVELKEVC